MFDETSLLAAYFCSATNAAHAAFTGLFSLRRVQLCLVERKPPHLDLENYPHLPAPQVAKTVASDYLRLLAAGAP